MSDLQAPAPVVLVRDAADPERSEAVRWAYAGRGRFGETVATAVDGLILLPAARFAEDQAAGPVGGRDRPVLDRAITHAAGQAGDRRRSCDA